MENHGEENARRGDTTINVVSAKLDLHLRIQCQERYLSKLDGSCLDLCKQIVPP